jgi:DNA-binding MarR family transcriptional regulator
MDRAMPHRDAIDEIRAAWLTLRPDMDTTAVGTVGRVLRIARVVTLLSDELLASFGMSRGEFDVLSAVRRSPIPLTSSDLARALITSNASITKRMVQLEGSGLAVRERSADDRRVVYVQLTEAGVAKIDEAVPRLIAFEASIASSLSDEQREEFEGALRRMLRQLELRGHTTSATLDG